MTGLIIIDCWAPDPIFSQASKNNKKVARRKNNFFASLVDNLKRFKFTAVINASTQNIQLSEHVERYISTYPDVFNLQTQRDFFELRKINPWKTVNHWIVVGTTWQVCVHLNDLGLCSFSTMSRQHPELNFYGAPWGFLKHDLTTTTNEDFATDLLTWIDVGQMYRLHPEIIDNLDQSTQCAQTHEIRNKYIDATPY